MILVIVDVNAVDVNAVDVNAVDVNAVDVNAVDVKAVDVKAVDVKAVDARHMLVDSTARMYEPISEQELRARLAQNLRRYRATQNISQEGLADIAGLHRTFVSQVEREVRNLSLDNIAKLANALQVDPVELFKP